MAKGLFTQCLCLLLDAAPANAAIEACVPGLVPQPGGHPEWMSWTQSWWLPAPELGDQARLVLDVIPRPWPDDCGEADQPALFGAWCLGYLGPLTFPGGLQRALRHSTLSFQHGAVLQLKASYALGSDEEASLLPHDYRPRAELEFMQGILRSLASLPQVGAYYNPAGEVLLSRRDWLQQEGLPLWVGTHCFATDRSQIATTVGMEQFDLLDQQAEVSDLISMDSLRDFVMQRAAALWQAEGRLDGSAVEGLGLRWCARQDESVGPRPRTSCCWSPEKIRRRGWFGLGG
jgi:hypothetical protein